MTPLSLFGLLLAVTGSILGLIGAWGTSAKDQQIRHFGFFLWTLNSPMLVLSMIGIALGWWESMSILPMIILNLIYWGTAVRGYLNTRSKPEDEYWREQIDRQDKGELRKEGWCQ